MLCFMKNHQISSKVVFGIPTKSKSSYCSTPLPVFGLSEFCILDFLISMKWYPLGISLMTYEYDMVLLFLCHTGYCTQGFLLARLAQAMPPVLLFLFCIWHSVSLTLQELALNWQSSWGCLLSIWDYSHAPLCTAGISFIHLFARCASLLRKEF
jgi:hypothetical protein